MEPEKNNREYKPGVFQGTPDFSNLSSAQKHVAPLIRTMKSDMAEAVKNQKETSVSIAIAEGKKREKAQLESEKQKALKEGPVSKPEQKRVGRFVVILIVLLVAIALVLSYIFILPKIGQINFPKISLPSLPSFGGKDANALPLEQVTPLAPSILKAEAERRFDITTQDSTQILSGLAKELASPLNDGKILNFYFTETVGTTTVSTTASKLLTFAKAGAPDLLIRSLDTDFMFGLYGTNSGAAEPFVILKTLDYRTGLAGMLEWEPSLVKAVEQLANVDQTNTSSIKFRDVIVTGKDSRTYTTPAGLTVYYALANQNTIVITGSQSALGALLSLAARK